MRGRPSSRRRAAQLAGQVEPAFARHHHVEHDQVEGEARQIGARLRRRGGGRHAKAVLRQIAAQQFAQPRIVVDDEKVGFGLAHRRQYTQPPLRCRAELSAARG